MYVCAYYRGLEEGTRLYNVHISFILTLVQIALYSFLYSLEGTARHVAQLQHQCSNTGLVRPTGKTLATYSIEVIDHRRHRHQLHTINIVAIAKPVVIRVSVEEIALEVLRPSRA